MAYLSAAVVVIGVLTILNLLLTVGVIRRIREHTEQLASADQPGGRGLSILGQGEAVGAFTAIDTDGVPVDLDPAAETLVGVFSTNCEPCKSLLPEFVDYVSGLPDGGSRVLAVVVGPADEAVPMVTSLSPVAQVVMESYDGPVAGAFRTMSFPSVYRVGADRRVVVSGHSLQMIRRPVPAGSPG